MRSNKLLLRRRRSRALRRKIRIFSPCAYVQHWMKSFTSNTVVWYHCLSKTMDFFYIMEKLSRWEVQTSKACDVYTSKLLDVTLHCCVWHCCQFVNFWFHISQYRFLLWAMKVTIQKSLKLTHSRTCLKALSINKIAFPQTKILRHYRANIFRAGLLYNVLHC